VANRVRFLLPAWATQGPRKDEPGYDFVIQGMTGYMSVTGDPNGPPQKVGVAIADLMTGLYTSTAILAALQIAQQTGRTPLLCAGWRGSALRGAHGRR